MNFPDSYSIPIDQNENAFCKLQVCKSLLQQAMTDKIDDREMFMKGIDYSYYYEQEE